MPCVMLPLQQDCKMTIPVTCGEKKINIHLFLPRQTSRQLG